ncbi:hypothetical protein LMH87_001700 [Akanthomyces muscarius]|uniref:Uncharacterized protein n=1 Tax=Akanthomyces muscarius TaxID=2231603 RepID=A0A9W8Q6W3_AKAMU|nr:hypothetical protein LMH87_001700 [Akanthomyces muscarius]KAJ4147155.1 hypothetical protein LMH87_001700 [Akanthomyces muscarius]
MRRRHHFTFAATTPFTMLPQPQDPPFLPTSLHPATSGRGPVSTSARNLSEALDSPALAGTASAGGKFPLSRTATGKQRVGHARIGHFERSFRGTQGASTPSSHIPIIRFTAQKTTNEPAAEALMAWGNLDRLCVIHARGGLMGGTSLLFCEVPR